MPGPTDKDIGRLEEAVTTLKTLSSDLREDREKDNDKFYELFNKMNGNLIKLNGTMETMTLNFTQHQENDEEIHEKQDKRLSSLENGRLQVLAWAGGAGTVMTGLLILVDKVFLK